MGKEYSRRIKLVYFIFAALFISIFLRIIYIQILKKDFLRGLAQGQHYRIIPLESKRGRIFDCNRRILAVGMNSYSIAADPLLIENIEQTCKLLSVNLGLSREGIREKLKRKKRFVWLKRKISWQDKEKIRALKLKGIGFIRGEKRLYPQETLASTVLGVVDIDNKGVSGVELFYDRYLRGKGGCTRVLQDSGSQEIIFLPQIINPLPGVDLYLTIDTRIQYWVEYYLRQTIEEFSAKKGSVVVMDASNGEIVALANYPDFNPNHRAGLCAENMKNCAVSDIFEPGSVFKIVTLLAAIEKNKFSDKDKIFCENGKYKIPGRYLHDWKPSGTLDFRTVFKKSSNIGVAKIACTLGEAELYKYIRKLGFGKKTRIDFPGEEGGQIRPPRYWSKSSKFIIPIGQEISVNLVQLTRAFAVIANEGYLVRPHIVREISAPFFFKKTEIKKKRVVSQTAAKRAKSILIDVVEDGTAKLAALDGVSIGGKTGTAQKYDVLLKKYSPTKYQASFVGFISSLNPPLVIGITIDEPKKSHFGGVVAAPLFREIARKIVSYR